MSRHRAELALFLKFGAVGLAGLLVDAAVLQAGLALDASAAAARALSVLVAIHVTFAANDRLVFGAHRARQLPARWLGYLTANGFGALCNYGLFLTLVASKAPVISHPMAALAIASAAAWGVNYAGSRLLAFRAPAGGA